MARTKYQPGRTLTVFFIGLAIAFGLVASAGNWKPELGLDLQGGTRITLVAEGNPSSESLKEARSIIDQRVNGSGVSEAEVTTQGNRFIQVEIPGENRRDLVETVERQAQLRFRLVACDSAMSASCGPAGTAGLDDTGGIAEGMAPRAAVGAVKTADETPAPAAESGTPSPAVSGTPSPAAEGTADATPAKDDQAKFDEAVAFINNPSAEWANRFATYQCPTTTTGVKDDPNTPLVTCNPEGTVKYLLSPAIIEGTDLTDASFGIPQGEVTYAVTLEFNKNGRDMFADATGYIAGTGQQFAIVLDGQVLSAPTASSRITTGAQITGDFTEAEARNLANSLKYGSLPIAFEDNVTVEVVGPTLAGNQLSAGLLAGGLGLFLVMLYCLVYYRALGLVVLASFAVAGAWTYALVLLLSNTAGFTLTLPGIAGLIIAVGVTADSFIIFFERIRDEMRDGKSMRVAVESGWIRARQTRVAANVVQLLSAAVLFIFASGAVKGFGFALGLTTLIDLAVLFWFTKPMVSLLARYKFFNGGGKWSGLSVDRLGMEEPSAPLVKAGGKA